MGSAVVETGDVLLFSGGDAIHHFVARHTGGPWVQVALVIELPGRREPCVFECNSRPRCPDVERGAMSPGVRTAPLAARVASAEGAVAVRALQPRLGPDIKRRFCDFARSVAGLPFDFSLQSSRRTLRRANEEFDGRSFMCCSLAAAAYQAIGVMRQPPSGPCPNNVWPSDFIHDERLGLKGEFSLGPVEVIKAVEAVTG